MNKTISVNIAGFVFNIEEQAYERLSEYLDKIRTNFSDEDERDEIMNDIELRIAELFQEKVSQEKEVIAQEDISEVIDILGHPEDFATEDDNSYASGESKNDTTEPRESSNSRRLYRDKDNATVGGVCSGLGHYFGLDPALFRILFILLFVLFGSGILLYIILFIIIPEAKTTSEKIEMKGGAVNVESIKDHVSNIKQTISDSTSKSQIKDNIKGAVDKSIKAGHSLFDSLSNILGAIFTLGGILLFVFFALLIFGNTGLLPFIGPDRIENLSTLVEIIYPGAHPSSLIFISILLVIAIPIVSLIITGVRMLFKYKHNVKRVAWSLSTLWVVAGVTLFFYSVKVATSVTNHNEITTPIVLNDPSTNELFVDVLDDDQFSNHVDPYDDWGTAELIKVDKQFIYLGLPELHIEPMLDTGDFKITLIKESRGATTRDAVNKIERIEYPIITKGNKLYLSPYIKMPRTDKVRIQHVTVEILVPNGKTIKFGKNIDRIWRDMVDGKHPWEIMYTNSQWQNLDGIFEKN